MTTNRFGPTLRIHAIRGKKHENKVNKERKSRSSKPLGIVAGGLGVASLLGIAGALLGYGVGVAIQDRFVIPYEPLFSSTFDLIELSVVAIMQLFERFSTLELLRDVYGPAFADMLLPAVLLSAAWIIAAAAIVYRKRIGAAAGALPERLKGWAAGNGGQPSDRHRWVMLMLKGLAFVAVMLLSIPLLMWGMLLAILSMLFFLSMLPLIGMSSAGPYLDKYVIQPAACAPLRTRVSLMAPPANRQRKPHAICVTVENPRQEPATGRVVFATSSAIVLFHPATGAVTRVPVKDARITVIGSL